MDRSCTQGSGAGMILCANPSAQVYSYQAEIEDAVLRVLRSDRYILGPEVSALEQEFAAYIGTTHAVGVANGTDALELALRALDLKPSDEVITVSHTAVATVAAIEAAGAVPVLVDVDPDFYTLNSTQLMEVLSSHTRAVIVVHLYGQAADLDEIKQTTLMIKNVPIKFHQQTLLDIVNKKFEGRFNYFYLPKDMRTQKGVGFAFINLIHPAYIIEFFLEFHCIKWSEYIQNCNSTKYCEISYSNVQGIEEIKEELEDKYAMKKEEGQPIFNDN